MQPNKIKLLLQSIEKIEKYIEDSRKDNDTYMISHYKAVLTGLNLALKIFME